MMDDDGENKIHKKSSFLCCDVLSLALMNQFDTTVGKIHNFFVVTDFSQIEFDSFLDIEKDRQDMLLNWQAELPKLNMQNDRIGT